MRVLLRCVFTWEGSTDGDDTQQHRGEHRQRRGPELAPAPPRAGEQQHPWGFLVDGEPLAGTEAVVIPPSLSVLPLFFFLCFCCLFVCFLMRAKASAITRAGYSGELSVHTLRTVIRGRAKDRGASGREGGGV